MGSITFIVRVSTDEVGRLVGIVEHVRTGRKEQFEGREAIGSVIASLLPTAECSNPRQRRRGRA